MVSSHWLGYFSIQLSSSVCGSLRNFAERHVTSWYWFFLCFDLGVVMVGHPTAILQSVAWSFNDNTAAQINNILKHIYEILQAFAFCALLHNEHWSLSCHCASFLLPSLRNQTQAYETPAAIAVTMSLFSDSNVFHPTVRKVCLCNYTTSHCYCVIPFIFHELQNSPDHKEKKTGKHIVRQNRCQWLKESRRVYW